MPSTEVSSASMPETPGSSVQAFIGLGANLGDARATLQAAVKALEQLPHSRLIAVSPLCRTAPIEASGPDFLNAVAELQTALPPLALLQALQDIEQAHGRERPYINAPRTLDLDLLLYGTRRLDSARLVLPHPRMLQRAFVLAPLARLAPGLMLQAQDLGPPQAIEAWLADLPPQRLEWLSPGL